MTAWEPEYPTLAARQYRDAFLAGMKGLTDVPADVLSYAIDRAIAAGAQASVAGLLFAQTYVRVSKYLRGRPAYAQPLKWRAYLLAAYEEELTK